MERRDIIEELISYSNFKPDNIEKVKLFTNTYIEKLTNLLNLEEKDYVIYLSGPVTNVEGFEARFNGIELVVYKAFSAYDVYVINPMEILPLVDEYDFTYIDKIFICYSLLSISNVLIYDNRDDKFLKSMGVFSEVSFALGKGIEIFNYTFIKETLSARNIVVSDDSLLLLKSSIEPQSEVKNLFGLSAAKNNLSADTTDHIAKYTKGDDDNETERRCVTSSEDNKTQ